MGDWADLIPDLLLLIAQRINLLEDFIAFGAVCKSWRSVVAAKENFNGPQQVPWLMLDARDDDDDDDDDERYFLSLTKYRLRDRRVTLPEAKGKQCLESLGWLVTVSEEGEMNLLHPLSRRQIGLPHLSTLKNFKYDSRLHKWLFIRKAVLSSNPSKEENYPLVVIYGFRFGFLGFWRPGDEAWTTIETQEGSCVDVTYHKGKFYGIDIDQGAIFVCDVGGSNPTLAQVVEEIPFEIIASHRSYIVESAGRLLIIAQHKFQLENLRFDSNIDGEPQKFRV